MLHNQIAFRRISAGTLLILAPLLQFAAVVVDPGTRGDDRESVSFGVNPALAQVQSVLYHWSWVLMPVAALGPLHVTRRRTAAGTAGPPAGRGLTALALIGGALTVVGYVNLSALLLIDPVEWWLGRHHPADRAAELSEEILGLPGVVFGFRLPWAFLGLLGLPLLTVAVWRAGFAGWWAPLPVTVGSVSSFAVPYGPAAVVCRGVPVIALGALGVRVLRMGDAGWAAYHPGHPGRPGYSGYPAPGRTTPDSYANTTA